MTLDPEIKKILDMRFAKGEITSEEYRETLNSLIQADKAHPTTSAASSRSVSQPNVAPSQGPVHQTYVQVPRQPESVAFAVVTLLFWIFLAPVGLILNFVGLLTGPRRGCFASMLLVFVVLPIVLLVILTVAGIPVIEEIVQAFEELVESY